MLRHESYKAQGWRWWAGASVLAPFAVPLVLVHGPRVAERPAGSLVQEFGALFEELLEAETRRRWGNGLPL